MWLGVVLAVILSIVVGVGLDLAEQALPQSRQEGMESVIGAIAIFFVTGMIFWMNAHAHDMRRQLESEAADAISQASAYALASMAFLAVLKEGFETSVFLLATFSAAQSAELAAAGAIIGLLLAVVIGWGIYIGGVRINLARFFSFTGAFLLLVAAGLVISSLRTAHEAGWLNVGQQLTMNLSWLVAPGTVSSALITGVLGIPADPRLIEVTGWLIYLFAVASYLYWPTAIRPRPRLAARLQIVAAMMLAALALGLFLFYPVALPGTPERATLVMAAGPDAHSIGTVRLEPGLGASPAMLKIALNDAQESELPLPSDQLQQDNYDGIDVSVWAINRADKLTDAPSTLTLDQVVSLNGGRVPIGLNPQQHPGPFAADWSTQCSTRVWLADNVLLDASSHATVQLILSGSGLQTPRTLIVNNDGNQTPACHWQVDDAYRNQVIAALNGVAAARDERRFWTIGLPLALALAALSLIAAAARMLIRLRRVPRAAMAKTSNGHCAENPNDKGATHAER